MSSPALRLSEFGGVLLRFASAQAVSNVLRIVSGFLVVRLLPPSEYGMFSAAGVYVGYVLMGHGGVINGLGRELPYELGRGNHAHAKELASAAYALSFLLSLLAVNAFLAVAFHHYLLGQYRMMWVFLTYTVIGGTALLSKAFLPVLYRTNADFDSLSRQNIRVGILNLLTVPVVAALGVYGLMLRGLILALYELYLLFENKPYPITLRADLRHLRGLLRTGLPIFAVGYVNPLWNTLLGTGMIATGGHRNFGLYALSTIILGALGMIPIAFSQVIYPRMSIMYGEGRSINAILRRNIKPLYLQVGLLLLLATLGSIALPVLVPVVLPQYTGGIKAAQWMLLVPLAESFGALNNIFNVVKQQFWYFVALISGAIGGSLFIAVQYHSEGFALETFPQGLLIGKLIQQGLSIAFIRRLA